MNEQAVNSAFTAWRREQLQTVEQHLEQLLAIGAPPVLQEAMSYAVLNGGKRMRALLTLATAAAVAADNKLALNSACAVELIHAYSLVHDDMPCMDDDQLRRGKPTVHVKYGQSTALLVGDALQSLAFEVLTDESFSGQYAAEQVKLCRMLAVAAGGAGMAGGQAIDLQNVKNVLTEQQLQQMHRLKTGALIHAAVMMGCAAAAIAPTQRRLLSEFGWLIGLAFQVTDDVLDETATTSELGKTAGKDKTAGKPTYVSLMGLEPAQRYAEQLLEQAVAKLELLAPPLQQRAQYLKKLAFWAIARS